MLISSFLGMIFIVVYKYFSWIRIRAIDLADDCIPSSNNNNEAFMMNKRQFTAAAPDRLSHRISRWLSPIIFGSFLLGCTSSIAQSTNQIEVRMQGTAGSESVSLQVGGTTVNTWTTSTALSSYTASTSLSGDVRVVFTNDATGRDVRVDYIVVNGVIRQAEQQAVNTAYYANGRCGGGGNSEQMHCNGYISFGNVGAPVTTSSSAVANSSTASACANTGQQCNWYGTNYPLCVTTQSGWGYENNRSCISRTTCTSQPSPYGVVGANNCPTSSAISVSSSSVAVTPSSSPIVSSLSSSSRSSVATIPSSSSTSSIGNNDPLQPTGVENSGAGCFIPALTPYANLTANVALPDPFRSMNGDRISSKFDWTCRRTEVSKQAQFYELGEKPEPSTASVSAFASGNTIAVSVQANGQSISFNATVQYPSTGTAPFPAVIGVGGSSLNNNGLLSRGIAVINFPNNDIAEQTNGSSRGKGKFYTLYGSNHGAGAMTAWAWGVSRLIDALGKTPGARIDAKRLGVTGCSRNGKGALIGGALDERTMLAIPQESGSGGSAAWRVSDAQKSNGQNVQTLSQIVTENVWFRSNFSQFGSTATRLPFDHHQVLGMVAPRALLVLENTDQEWLGNVSTYTSAVAAREIWTALGVADRMSVSQLGGYSHCVFPSSQQAVLDAFVDKFLKNTGSGNTSIVRTSGSYSVDRARWINWTTPALQ